MCRASKYQISTIKYHYVFVFLCDGANGLITQSNISRLQAVTNASIFKGAPNSGSFLCTDFTK
jgi:hypothetical protein